MASAHPDLRNLQKVVFDALLVPLTAQRRISRRQPNVRAAAALIQANSRLTSDDRLEIYSRSYWSRVLDSLRDDFPGLAAILGPAAFHRLAVQYLQACPSNSFTLRNLGARLETWFRQSPAAASRNADLVLDMVRLEWAHIEAWDCFMEPALQSSDMEHLGPASKLLVQPGIGLLDLLHPVDELRIQVNAADEDQEALAVCRHRAGILKRSAPRPLFVAVHRSDLSVYYRHLQREEYLLLKALRQRKSISVAIRVAFADTEVPADAVPGLLRTWFATWSQLGWLCPVPTRSTRRKI